MSCSLRTVACRTTASSTNSLTSAKKPKVHLIHKLRRLRHVPMLMFRGHCRALQGGTGAHRHAHLLLSHEAPPADGRGGHRLEPHHTSGLGHRATTGQPVLSLTDSSSFARSSTSKRSRASCGVLAPVSGRAARRLRTRQCQRGLFRSELRGLPGQAARMT